MACLPSLEPSHGIAAVIALCAGAIAFIVHKGRAASDRVWIECCDRIIDAVLLRAPKNDPSWRMRGVRESVSFILRCPSAKARRHGTARFVVLACREVIKGKRALMRFDETRIREVIPDVVKELEKSRNRKATVTETAILAWYTGKITFDEIPNHGTS